MIADYYESFEEDRDNNLDIPQEILEILNQGLPSNFFYYKDPKTGKYRAIPRPESILQDMILKANFDEEALGKLKNIPEDKWAEYLYRTQKPIPVKNLRIGDKDAQIPIENTLGNPFNADVKVKEIMMCPAQFPEPVPFFFESPEGDMVEMHIQQQAYDSLTEIKFANVDFPALHIEFFVKNSLLDNFEEDEDPKVSFSVNPIKAETVSDALAALHIFIGLFEGKTKINGTVIKPEGTSINLDQRQIADLLLFWSTAKRLEERLGVSFKPDAEFPDEDAHFFTELEVCLLNGKSISWKHPFEHFHVGGVNLTNKFTLEDIIGKEKVSYRFVEGPISATLLGAEFELFSNTEMVDLVVTNIEWDDDEKTSAEIYITDAPGNTWRLIRQYITAEEAEKQKAGSDDDSLKK